MLSSFMREAMRHPIYTHPPRPPEGPKYVVGLDLGQAQDYTALCVVERRVVPDPAAEERTAREYFVRHLHRWTLGTPYTAILDDLAELSMKEPLPKAKLVVDATGVGKPVIDMIRRAGLSFHTVPITIHGGHGVTPNKGGYFVPKADLVGTMQALVQARRFHVAPELPDAPVLGRELQQFRVKVKLATGNETFESWREREHDDLVLSVALACWYGQHKMNRWWIGFMSDYA